ncbi:MAG: DUF975 family protein [Clostridia bacterium]|nr:DUF975 family protein [Clostridia bacterium]
MQKSSEYRRRARVALDGNIFSNTWLLVLVAALIYGAIVSALSFTVVGLILVEGPLMLGLSIYLLNMYRANEKKNQLGTLFDGFKGNFGDSVLLGFLRDLFICLWSLLLVVPGIIKAYSYSMAFYIKADHPEYNWKQCIDESRKMMNGKKWKLFCLQLSFIGWFIVGALCLGVGTLWAAAYCDAATIAFYEDAKAE